jgi:hypothetical protein
MPLAVFISQRARSKSLAFVPTPNPGCQHVNTIVANIEPKTYQIRMSLLNRDAIPNSGDAYSKVACQQNRCNVCCQLFFIFSPLNTIMQSSFCRVRQNIVRVCGQRENAIQRSIGNQYGGPNASIPKVHCTPHYIHYVAFKGPLFR